MKKMIRMGVTALAMAAVGAMAGSASAQSLLEKADKGEPIRIGFANEIPFAYPGDDGSPKGFVNAFTGPTPPAKRIECHRNGAFLAPSVNLAAAARRA